MDYPAKIICLTEESVELLYLLGEEKRICGVSVYVRRPQAATLLPKVSAFTHSNLNKIVEITPDLVLGFSDIQKDIAKELIGRGINVFVTNQRSLANILDYCLMLSRVVGKRALGERLVESWKNKMKRVSEQANKLKRRPKVYFEEWDEPTISAIRWVGEMIELCGGDYIFRNKLTGSLASDRIVTRSEVKDQKPDIILICWCGKKADLKGVKEDPHLKETRAVREDQVFELEPEIFLQPGPAIFIDGLDKLSKIFSSWQSGLDDT